MNTPHTAPYALDSTDEDCTKPHQLGAWLNEEDTRLQTTHRPAFFTAVENGELTKETLREEMLKRYELSLFFNDYLAKLLETLGQAGYAADHPLASTLAENLAEELGVAGTEYGNFIHENSRAQFIRALGVDYPTWAQAKGSLDQLGDLAEKVKAFYQGYCELLSTPVQAYAALAYWEWRVSRPDGDYKQFLNAFEALYPEFKKDAYVPGDALWHLYSHSVHDDDHAAAFFKALRHDSTPSDILAGVAKGATLWDAFWSK